MAYHIEKNGDIVINGWEKGVASSPHEGIGNLKNINISTIPGEAMVNFARTLSSQGAILSGTISNDTGATNELHYAGTTPLIPGTWVQVLGGSTITNFTNSTGSGGSQNFFVKDLVSGTTTNGEFSFALTYGGTAINNFGTSGTATFNTYQNVNRIINSAIEYVNSTGAVRYYVVDAIGLVWVYPYNYSFSSSSWGLIDPPNASQRANSGIFLMRGSVGYLFRASDGSGGGGSITSLEWKSTSSLGSTWTTFGTSGNLNTGVPHRSIIGVQDNTAWICNGSDVAELAIVANKVFDPTDNTTYTYDSTAIQLWFYETTQCIAELGSLLVIGGYTNNLYLFDRASTNATGAYTVIPLVEGNVQNAVTAGNVVYLFVGSKGHIYVTSGAIVSPVLNIPDYVTAEIEPYYIWGGATFLRGRIFFSFKDSNSMAGGIWSFTPIQGAFIEQDIGTTLRLENISTYNTYAGYTTVLIPIAGTTGQNAQGPQYFSAWDNGSSVYGIDASALTPYVNGEAVIETDIIPIGTFLEKKTLANIEYKLATPLVAGESITIKYRQDLTSAFANLPAFNTETSSVSAYAQVNFEKIQWIQLQASLTSTASNPSYVRLSELRLR